MDKCKYCGKDIVTGFKDGRAVHREIVWKTTDGVVRCRKSPDGKHET